MIMSGILSEIHEIIDLIIYLQDIERSIAKNNGRCLSLIARCKTFEAPVRRLMNIDCPNQSGMETLLLALRDSKVFINKYCGVGMSRFFRKVRNVMFAKTIEQDFKELDGRLSKASADLQFDIVLDIRELEAVGKTDNEEIVGLIGDLIESSGLSTRSEIVKLAKDQDSLFDKVSLIETMVPKFDELIERTGALFELTNIGVLEQQDAAPVVVSQSTSNSKSSASVDALKYAEIDPTLLNWNKEVTDLVGKGSFASVYRCSYDGTPHAVKYFENIHGLSNKEVLSIKKEASIMCLTKHTNIIGFVGVNMELGLILTELAQGSLFDVLHKGLRFPGTVAESSLLASTLKMEWMLQIARALRYLHFHNIIHRDVKPQNILLVNDIHMNRVTLKLGDFGIATSVKTSTIGTSSVSNAVGSMPYMAPELIDFEEKPHYSTAVDVYAYGVVANEMLTECAPWEGLTARQIEKSVEKGRRPTIFVSTSDVEAELVKLIGSVDGGCWSTKSEDRISSSEVCVLLQGLCPADVLESAAMDAALARKVRCEAVEKERLVRLEEENRRLVLEAEMAAARLLEEQKQQQLADEARQLEQRKKDEELVRLVEAQRLQKAAEDARNAEQNRLAFEVARLTEQLKQQQIKADHDAAERRLDDMDRDARTKGFQMCSERCVKSCGHDFRVHVITTPGTPWRHVCKRCGAIGFFDRILAK